MNHQELYREKLYSGPIFDLAKVRMRLPSGRERDYDLVEHGNSVTIVPVDASGQVYFVDQHRVGSNSMLLELPAGMLDAGEDPLEGARREIREEIGMDAEQIIPLGGFYLAAGYSDEYLFAYLAKGLFASPLDPMKMNLSIWSPCLRKRHLKKRLQANFMMEKPWLHFFGDAVYQIQ